MAQLVCQRERVVQRTGVVHEHIRMHAEHAAGERAGLVLPSFSYTSTQRSANARSSSLLVLLAQRQRRLLD